MPFILCSRYKLTVGIACFEVLSSSEYLSNLEFFLGVFLRVRIVLLGTVLLRFPLGRKTDEAARCQSGKILSLDVCI